MKVKYIVEDKIYLTTGKTYVVESIERGFYRTVDNTDDDFLFGPKLFEVLEETNEHYKQMVDNLHLKCGDKVRVTTEKMYSLKKGKIFEVVETKGEWPGIKIKSHSKKETTTFTYYYHPDLFEVVK